MATISLEDIQNCTTNIKSLPVNILRFQQF